MTAGGRVLGVTALGATLDEARARAYRGWPPSRWPGMHVPHRHRPGGAAATGDPDPTVRAEAAR